MSYIHGETIGGKPTAEYKAWTDMKRRCYNPSCHSYKNYGGRGISVCEEWFFSFENFLKSMGRRPSNEHTLGRIDNSDNYCPRNCRWETRAEQNLNRRATKLTLAKAKIIRKLVSEGWTERDLTLVFKVSKGTIYYIKHNQSWIE